MMKLICGKIFFSKKFRNSCAYRSPFFFLSVYQLLMYFVNISIDPHFSIRMGHQKRTQEPHFLGILR
jgi:hypothetical protein